MLIEELQKGAEKAFKSYNITLLNLLKADRTTAFAKFEVIRKKEALNNFASYKGLIYCYAQEVDNINSTYMRFLFRVATATGKLKTVSKKKAIKLLATLSEGQ